MTDRSDGDEPGQGSPTTQPADLVIRDATVITMDASGTVHEAATVVIRGDRIDRVEPSGGQTPVARRVLDAGGAIVLPGLVNAHTHLAMTLFRGVADDCDLDGFLARILPVEAALLGEDAVAAGAALGVAEGLLGGMTAALDMYFFPEAAEPVAAAAGMDLFGGPVFVEFPAPDERPFPQRLEWAAQLLADTPPDRGWVCPHSTYLLSDEHLSAVGALAASTGAGVHVHASETQAELGTVAERHGGRSPVRVLRDAALLGPRTVLAHAVHLTAADIDLVAEAGAAVAHCPASNQKLGSGYAPIPELLAAGVTVALGTDGAASANDLDLWQAMRLAAYPLAARRGPGAVRAADVLAMATTGGARALGLADRGTVEPGRRADLVVLDADSPALTPSYDPVSTAVYAASRADVRWVVAAGRLVVDERRLTTVDLPAALDAVRGFAPAIARLAYGASAG
jgi:5-methylthioadenosine/S-adenosylhomocysteine deaminase